MQAQVGDDCNELEYSFEQFQRKLRQVILEAKRKKGFVMHQQTIHGTLKPGILPL